MNYKYTKIENQLLNTVFKKSLKSEENIIPELGINLLFNGGYFLPLNIDNDKDPFNKQVKENFLMNNILKYKDMTYIHIKDCGISIKIKDEAFINFIQKLNWNKPSLNSGDIASISEIITKTLTSSVNINVNMGANSYRILGFEQINGSYKLKDINNDLSVGLFSAIYCLIKNYIAKNRVDVGEEYEIIRNNLSSLESIYGNVTLYNNYPQIQQMVLKYNELFFKLFESLLNEFLYPYLDISISRISDINVDISENNYRNIYEEVKILIGNIVGINLDEYSYRLMSDTLNYALYFEDAWEELVRLTLKEKNYLDIIGRHLKSQDIKHIDEYLISRLNDVSNGFTRINNTKTQYLINRLGVSGNKDLKDKTKFVDGVTNNIKSFINDYMDNIKNSKFQQVSGVEYRNYYKYTEYSIIKKIYVVNEAKLMNPNEPLYQLFNKANELVRNNLAIVEEKVVDSFEEFGVNLNAKFNKIKIQLPWYDSVSFTFYIDIYNNKQYFRYIEVELEEPIVEEQFNPTTPELQWN